MCGGIREDEDEAGGSHGARKAERHQYVCVTACWTGLSHMQSTLS